jgi:hypothetical protein
MGQNLGYIFLANLDLNAPPIATDLDLNAPFSHLNDEDFLELNDLINPVIHNHEVVLRIIQHAFPENAINMEVDGAQPGESDITLTIRSAHAASNESGGSVNGGLLLLFSLVVLYRMIFTLGWCFYLMAIFLILAGTHMPCQRKEPLLGIIFSNLRKPLTLSLSPMTGWIFSPLSSWHQMIMLGLKTCCNLMFGQLPPSTLIWKLESFLSLLFACSTCLWSFRGL